MSRSTATSIALKQWTEAVRARALPEQRLPRHVFQLDGKVLTDFTSSTREYVACVFVDNSAVGRYTNRGTLDTSFSGDGNHPRPHRANEFALSARGDSSGRIIAAGAATNQNGSGLQVVLPSRVSPL